MISHQFAKNHKFCLLPLVFFLSGVVKRIPHLPKSSKNGHMFSAEATSFGFPLLVQYGNGKFHLSDRQIISKMLGSSSELRPSQDRPTCPFDLACSRRCRFGPSTPVRMACADAA